MKRGPLHLVFDGNNELVYTHADRLGSVSVSTKQSLHLQRIGSSSYTADFNSSKLSLFMDGQKKDEVSISAINNWILLHRSIGLWAVKMSF